MPDTTVNTTDSARSDHLVVEQESPLFSDFDIRPEIVTALSEKGIERTFPIQAMTLPVGLAGHDVIGQAKTGTGKTLGFGVPLLNKIQLPDPDDAGPRLPQALVVLPTRELAIQVARDLEQASSHLGIRVLTVYGGRSYEPQVAALTKGVDVVVGTPGRLLDLMRQKVLVLSQVRTAVLDEADEMLDLGFLEDIEKILAAVPSSRQTQLFSATMPAPIVALARRFMNRPTHIRAVDPGEATVTKADIKQVIYRAHALDKVEVLARILQARGRGLTIVFAQTKRTADRVANDLASRGFAAAPLHGDLGQGAREQALRAFRHGKIDVLVATDVAARGIDVEAVTHVVNYQCPADDKIYLHRTGRTGRAGHKGTAITFVDWEDVARWGLIARRLGLESTEPEEIYSTSPELFEELDIPTTAKGTLPKDKRTREGLDAEYIEDLGETGARHDRPHRGGSSSKGHGSRSRDDRGGRSSSDHRGGDRRRGERRGSESKGAEQNNGERAQRPPRRRRRTRGGKPTGGSASGSSEN